MDEFVAGLVRRGQHPPDESDAWLLEALGLEDAPPEELARCRTHLERLIQQGLDSGPAVEATAAFWEERRRVLEERLATTPRDPA